MNIKLISIFVLVAAHILCGCLNQVQNNETNLSDGTVITGDIATIQILSYELIKERKLSWNNQWDNSSYSIIRSAAIPGDVNISNIETNLSKRKTICLTYLDPNIPLALHPLDWDSDYFGYTHPIGRHITISNFQLNDSINSWRIVGTAKNLGVEKISLAMIVVNFYDDQMKGLAYKTSFKADISPDQSWDFEIRYTGDFKNDVDSISFEVDSNPFG